MEIGYYIEKCLSRYFLRNKKVTISLLARFQYGSKTSDHKQ